MKNPGRSTTVVESGEGIQIHLHRSTTEEMPRTIGRGNKQYATDVRNLFTQVFDSTKADLAQQDQIWDEWLGLEERKRREHRDLLKLLKQDVKDEFKARALTIVLLPGLRFSPFAWNDPNSLEDYLDEVVIATLSEKLRDFVIELVRVNIDAVQATNFNEKLYRSLFTYNAYILQILALLPVEDPRAAPMFDRYELNDPLGYANMEDSSGYNPFERILNPTGYIINHDSKSVRGEIPEHWKRLADGKMRAIIVAEQTGKAHPRYEWEEALPIYARQIQPSRFAERLVPYSAELLASQIDFILGLPNIASKHLFRSFNILATLVALVGDQHKELRLRLIRYEVFGSDETQIRVYDAEDRKLADAILNEFGETDHELRDRINELIAEGETRQHENEQHTNKRQAKVSAVLGKMK